MKKLIVAFLFAVTPLLGLAAGGAHLDDAGVPVTDTLVTAVSVASQLER